MPELPEVQTMVDDLNSAGLVGAAIRRAQVYWDRTIADQSAKVFCRKIKGRIIDQIYRRAKYIIFKLDNGFSLIVHLRMTGRFELGITRNGPGKHVQVVLELDNQQRLVFQDTRKFGRFYLTRTPDQFLFGLGPEPLDAQFSAKMLGGRLNNRRRQIKPMLLDQRFLAGLGNIYTDEALWRACIHPLRLASTLKDDEVVALHRAIRFVLRQAIRNGGTSLGKGEGNFVSARSGRGSNFKQLKVYRRTGLPCPRCRKSIVKIVVGQRGTHICEACQPFFDSLEGHGKEC